MPVDCCTWNCVLLHITNILALQYGGVYFVTIDREFSDVTIPYLAYLLESATGISPRALGPIVYLIFVLFVLFKSLLLFYWG